MLPFLSRVLPLVVLLLLLALIGQFTSILMHPLRLGRPLMMAVLCMVCLVLQLVSAVDYPGQCPDGRLSMLFEGSFGGDDGGRLKAPILLDSGASTNFVSPRLLKQLSISFTTSSAKLKLADNSDAPILGKVRLRFKLQNFTATVSSFVTGLCEEFDVLLGNTFMTSQRVILDYFNFTASFRRDGKLYTVTPSSILNDGASNSFDQLPKVNFRQHGVSGPSPVEDEATQPVNTSEHNLAFCHSWGF